jgi:hypothetical protein
MRLGDDSYRDHVADHAKRISELERGGVVLFGHAGQPGQLTLMSSKLDSQGHRINALEQYRWRLAGMVVAAGASVGLITTIIAKVMK